ncbi:DUF4189 domain-containing protein [Brevundimonas sp.]
MAGSFVMLVATLCLPSPALAQYPCSGNPGPGERVVGTTQGGNGMAPTPLCMQDEAPRYSERSSGSRRRVADNFFASAWHSDANNAWIAVGYLDMESAKRAAEDACNRAMGGGCLQSTAIQNGAIAIARGGTGTLYSSAGNDGEEAEQTVLRHCGQSDSNCNVINLVAATGPGGSTRVLEPRGDFRRR